jgi:hypothetical protein
MSLGSGIRDPGSRGQKGTQSWIRIRNTAFLNKFFVGLLKVIDESRRIRIRIRIHLSEAWIRGSGSTPKCHGSATLTGTVHKKSIICISVATRKEQLSFLHKINQLACTQTVSYHAAT